jgi:hypothetical protein
MRCPVCDEESRPAFEALVLRRHRVHYFHCPSCGLVHTEEPYWLDEAYASSITLADTGLLARNLHFAKSTTALLSWYFPRDARCLDYAGGYGVFTRLMRDIGFDFFWSDRHTTNLLARGFERAPETPVDVITAFEVMEHLPHPQEDLRDMISISRNVIFSTLLIPSPPPPPDAWWYYVLDYGQHVSLYSRKSLEVLAARFGLRLLTNGKDFHMMTDRNISNRMFRFLTGRAGRTLSRLLARRMKSRTESDMAAMSERIQ